MTYTHENVHIGRQMRTFRKAKRWTQKDLSNRIGIKDNTISAYERGAIEIPRSRLLEIATALDVKYVDFLPADTDNDELLIMKHIEAAKEICTEEEMLFLDSLIEKTLSLNDSERKDFLKNIRFAVEFFNK